MSVIVSFRDVKPDNILLDEQGKGVNCLLLTDLLLFFCSRYGLNDTLADLVRTIK